MFGAYDAKNWSLNPISPKIFQKFPFFGAFGAEKVVTELLKSPPPLGVIPPMRSLVEIIKVIDLLVIISQF